MANNGFTRDSSEVPRFLALYRESEVPAFLDQAYEAASRSQYPGAVELVRAYRHEGLTWPEELLALKYALLHDKGLVYNENSAIGRLYRDLLWDQDVDGIFLATTKMAEIESKNGLIYRAILGDGPFAPDSVEQAEQRVLGVYRSMVRSMAGSAIDGRIIPLARAVGMLDEVRETYRPYVLRLYEKVPAEAKRALEKLAQELDIELNTEQSSK